MKTIFTSLLLAAAAAALAVVALEMPTCGDPTAPAFASPLTAYYQTRATLETGCLNQVAAIVADYRAYDTLGETTVLFTAVAAILALQSARKDGEQDG